MTDSLKARMYTIPLRKVSGRSFSATANWRTLEDRLYAYHLVELRKLVLVDPIETYAGCRHDDEISFVPMEAVSLDGEGLKQQEKGLVSMALKGGYSRFREGDVLFAKISPCMENGKSAFAENLINGYGFGSTEFLVFRVVNDSLLPKFLLVYLQGKEFLKIAHLNMTGTTGHQRISVDNFIRHLKIPLPPIQIQQEIVEKMEAAYRVKREADAQAQDLWASIDDCVLEKLGIPKFELVPDALSNRVFTVPLSEVSGERLDAHCHKAFFRHIRDVIKNVAHMRLAEVVHLSNKQWDQKSWQGEGTFPYIEISGIDTVYGDVLEPSKILLSEAPSRAKMLVEADDLLVSLTRPTRKAIAKVPEQIKNAIASTGFAVIDYVVENVDKDYLFLILRSCLCAWQFEQRSSGGNYPAITQDQLLECIIPVPPASVQKEIVARVAEIRAEAKHLRETATARLAAAKREIEAMIMGE